MASLASGVSGTNTYYGNSEVNFFVNDQNALTVTIDTESLHIESVEASEESYRSYAALFGDPEVMKTFATGQTKTRAEMEERIKDVWVKRWHANDPYSGLAVFKNDEDGFIGHVVLGHGDAEGQAELAYLFKKSHWNRGFATEAATAVVQDFAPATVAQGYKLDGKTLEKIKATARPDNVASVRILEKLNMHKIGEEEKFGALRFHFSIDLSEISKKV
jgi:[ribosomal protein S5]-alanine N-acetyltransferase